MNNETHYDPKTTIVSGERSLDAQPVSQGTSLQVIFPALELPGIKVLTLEKALDLVRLDTNGFRPDPETYQVALVQPDVYDHDVTREHEFITACCRYLGFDTTQLTDRDPRNDQSTPDGDVPNDVDFDSMDGFEFMGEQA